MFYLTSNSQVDTRLWRSGLGGGSTRSTQKKDMTYYEACFNTILISVLPHMKPLPIIGSRRSLYRPRSTSFVSPRDNLLTVLMLCSVFHTCKDPYKARTLTEDASSMLGSSTVQQSRPPTNPQPQQYRGAVPQNPVPGVSNIQPRKRQRLE